MKNAEVAAEILKKHPDPLAPDAITAYFKKLYRDRKHDLDAKGIMMQIESGAGRLDFPFASIAQDFSSDRGLYGSIDYCGRKIWDRQ